MMYLFHTASRFCFPPRSFAFFFFNATATTEIYTLSLHDALPISPSAVSRSRAPLRAGGKRARASQRPRGPGGPRRRDRKSTRLNSSHTVISYAVFCLKKKKKKKKRNMNASRYKQHSRQ